jgi:pimeloyl-ACP methyl ester carboxylesterase
VDRLVVVDIAPRAYPGGHETIIDALRSLDLTAIQERGEADALLAAQIPERGVRQFLLKNLTRNREGSYAWKMNLPAIVRHYPEILDNVRTAEPFTGPTLFIRGERSDYVQDADWPATQQLFPNAELATVAGAGHWVHAEQPELLFGLVSGFLEG